MYTIHSLVIYNSIQSKHTMVLILGELHVQTRI